MIEALRSILTGALERLSGQVKTELPMLLAAAVILLVAVLIAKLARWLIGRAFKGIELDEWLRRTGVSAMINRSGTIRASRITGHFVYWTIVIAGCVAALNVFEARLTTRLAESFALLLPRLAGAAAILVGGMLLGQHLGRSALIWAVNEDIPGPRKLALAIRVLVVLGAAAVAANVIDFAGVVFLWAFILVTGGVLLTASLALGLGARDTVRRALEERERAAAAAAAGDRINERSLWNHL
jgi:hypothetical protein